MLSRETLERLLSFRFQQVYKIIAGVVVKLVTEGDSRNISRKQVVSPEVVSPQLKIVSPQL